MEVRCTKLATYTKIESTSLFHKQKTQAIEIYFRLASFIFTSKERIRYCIKDAQNRKAKKKQTDRIRGNEFMIANAEIQSSITQSLSGREERTDDLTDKMKIK